MRRAYGDVAIDLCTELRVFALTASQHRVDQSRCARMAEQACGFDCFRNCRVLGNIRVQQLTQADDGERAHVRIELLSRTGQQTIEQRVEAQVPADAVIGERAKESALLARYLAVERQ